MLNPDDRRAIEGLFDRLAEVERKSPNRDAEASRLIDQSIVRQPGAPYYLAQTVLVQEQALGGADQRIRELEEQLSRRDRGSFGRPSGPWDRAGRDERDDRNDQQQRGGLGGGWGGGGFLAGAAQTAMGVAGGVLLGNAIAGIFGVGSAHASEGNQDSAQDNGDSGSDSSDSGGDSGGDFGGGGDFDMGGDF